MAHDDESTLDPAHILQAHRAAWAGDDGQTRFAERFKYTIATSFLLTPTLSISMYQDADTRPGSGARRPPEPRAPPDTGTHLVTLRRPDAQRRRLFAVAAGATLVCVWLRLPLAVALLSVVVADALSLIPGLHERLSSSDTLQFALMHAPNGERTRFLAADSPTPSWVADERTRLQDAAMRQCADLVQAAHSMDRSVNGAIAALQEVELVSRGYALSSPLAPISRMEATDATRNMGASGASARVYPQRVPALRKDVADQLDQVTFHCRAACDTLAPLINGDALASLRGLSELRPLPSHTHSPAGHSRRLDQDGNAASPTWPPVRTPVLSPRLCAHTPPLPARVLGPASPPANASPWRPTPQGRPPSRAHGVERDRFALLSLRERFEGMHTARQAVLYHLLALDFSMDPAMRLQPQGPQDALRVDASEGVDASEDVDAADRRLERYWDETVIGGVLVKLAAVFRETGCVIRARLQAEMQVPTPPSAAPHPLTGHVGLADRLAEMSAKLRTIQCKLRVCSEELELVPPPRLHGEAPSPAPEARSKEPSAPPPDDPAQRARIRTAFDCMRTDLLALSSEWEAALHIVTPTDQDAHSDDARGDVRAHTAASADFAALPLLLQPTSSPTPWPPDPDTYRTETHGTDAAASAAARASDVYNGTPRVVDALLQSASPACLPPPGAEEVFECEPASPTPRMRPTALSRAERIALARQERAHSERAAQSADPVAIVTELKDVLTSRRLLLAEGTARAPPLHTT
ncbi:hypothetical protein MSPP1_002100 [Malassezia sp. CBS 17886]|nr:hypothetical protein MSPP1_002100 [Malassezia sp. CBS 17886]